MGALHAVYARHATPVRRRTHAAVLALALTLSAGGGIGLAGVVVRARTHVAGLLPGLPGDAAPRPLASVPPAPAGHGGYRVLRLEDDGSDRPVRWDPCRPIHYVVRPDGAPPGGAEALAAALRAVEARTGLRFVRDPDTDERPIANRPSMNVSRYGRRWSPVLIAWTDPTEYPPIAGFAGLGGPVAVGGSRPGRLRYVTGVVLLNRKHLRQVVAWDHGSRRMEAVITHELGHLVGLDHVDDPDELMSPRPGVRHTDLQPGDLRGLAAVGDGPCFRDF